MPSRLPARFYARDTLEVAHELLGKTLVRLVGGARLAARIVEVEAYGGVEDKASHARRGPTPRASIMFGASGLAYVYLIYGMHHCLNVVAHEEGRAGAVLVRAALPLGLDARMDGPGKLARSLSIDRSQNGADLVSGDELWLERGDAPARVVATPRVGVGYAGPEWAEKPWRLVAAGETAKGRAARR